MNNVSTFLYRVCEWIMRFAYLNILWIGFTFLGLFLLGFFPATISMFTIVRKWIAKQSDVPILKTFWETYKTEFLKGNILGFIVVAIGYLIYLEISILNNHSDPLLNFSKYPLFLLVLLLSFLILYLFPTYVHYNVTFFQIVKNAFLIMLVNPLNNIVLVLGLVLLYYVFVILPPLLVFFGGSGSAFFIMWTCYQSFMKIEQKKEKLNKA